MKYAGKAIRRRENISKDILSVVGLTNVLTVKEARNSWGEVHRREYMGCRDFGGELVVHRSQQKNKRCAGRRKHFACFRWLCSSRHDLYAVLDMVGQEIAFARRVWECMASFPSR